jgi:hypothetical protein
MRSNHYINNDDIIKEYHISMTINKCSDMLLKQFMLIAQHSSNIFTYHDEYDRSACINHAVAEAWRKWNTFNIRLTTNAFSFYTTMILNDMRNEYRRMYKNRHNFISLSIFDEM